MIFRKTHQILLLCASLILTAATNAQQMGRLSTTPGADSSVETFVSRVQAMHDGTRHHYVDGRLTKKVDSNGNETSYHYAGEKLTAIVLPDGTVQTAIYDGNRLLGFDSSTGKRLRFRPAILSIEAIEKTSGRARQAPVEKGAYSGDIVDRQKNALLNGILITNDGWESFGKTDCPLEQSAPDVVVICGGGGDPDPWVPDGSHPGDISDPGPENPDSGGGGGGSDLPPGAAPGDSPERASCMANAYEAWKQMNSLVCSKVASPANRRVCEDTNMRLYVEELARCRRIP